MGKPASADSFGFGSQHHDTGVPRRNDEKAVSFSPAG
jgi:hypothetical protein